MLILSVTTEIYILLLANRKSNIPPKFIFPDILYNWRINKKFKKYGPCNLTNKYPHIVMEFVKNYTINNCRFNMRKLVKKVNKKFNKKYKIHNITSRKFIYPILYKCSERCSMRLFRVM